MKAQLNRLSVIKKTNYNQQILKIKVMKTSIKILSAMLLASLFFSVSAFACTIPLNENLLFRHGSFIVIKGKVIDSKTKNPILFVAVTAVGTNIGTVSNKEGEFTFKLDDSLKVQQICFSHIGYKNVVKNVSEFFDGENTVKMEPTAVMLSEVTVRPNDAYSIVENMLTKISQNYSVSPNSMMAFYRETVKQRKRYVSISEAVVDVYKASYINDLKEDMTRLYKGRKSTDVKKQDTILFKLQGGPDGILLMDVIKNPYVLFSDGKIDDYLFDLDEVTTNDGRINYTVSFKQKTYIEHPLYFGKLYIDVETNALTCAEFSLNLADKNKAAMLFIQKKPLGMKITPETTSYIVKYKQNGNKFYFNYARNEVTFKVDWNKRLFKSYYSIMSEIAVTDRDDKNVSEFPRKDRLPSNVVFSEKISAFSDADFWGEYNTIQPEESIDAAIKKYGKRLMKENN
jgi:hypothetical protein